MGTPLKKTPLLLTTTTPASKTTKPAIVDSSSKLGNTLKKSSSVQII
jgi:hypothetical protein